MTANVVDLHGVQRGRNRLDKLAAAHPALLGQADQEAWEQTLRQDEEQTMASTTQVAFRLPDDLLEKVDNYATRMSAAQPGLAVSRTDAVRMLRTRALEGEATPRKRSGGAPGPRHRTMPKK